MSRIRTLAIVLAAACGNSNRTDTSSAPPIGKILAALLGAADQASSPWRGASIERAGFAGPRSGAAGGAQSIDAPAFGAEELKTGEHTWMLASQRLERTGDDRDIVIGVVADAAGDASQTIASLGRLRAALETAKPDLVITLGGMGATTDELKATLGTLSDRASWPLVALPGDLEAMTAQVDAIAALRTRGDVVLDGRSVRWIAVGGAMIGTIPGAGAVERLAAGAQGCQWQAGDVTRVTTEVSGATGLRIVAMAEAPREIIDGEAAGELALAPGKALPVDIVLHGPLTPAPSPAHSGSRDGAGYGLSPGTADATVRLPAAHKPSAGILVVRGATWSWRPVVDGS